MNARPLLVAALAASLLSGCLTASGPAWFDSGRIDMQDYSQARVLILPVEITPPYDLQPGDRRAIQDQIKNALARTFDLEVVDSLPSVERARVYPYDPKEIVDIGYLYVADAVAAISIFSLLTESPDPRSDNRLIGLRLSFTDVRDPKKSWVMSREYRSRKGFEADSVLFENTIRADLSAVRHELESKYGLFAGFRRTVTLGLYGYGDPGKPRVGITVPMLGAAFSDEQPATQALVTEQSLLQFVIAASHAAGVQRTEVHNRRAKFDHTLDYRLSNDENARGPQRIDEAVSVPLEVGNNEIEFVTYSESNAEPRENVIVVRREPREDVYTLGVGIAGYRVFGSHAVDSGELKRRFEERARSRGIVAMNNVVFLEGEEATRRQILRGLQDLGIRARRNDRSNGLFYFAGKVAAGKEGAFLLAYDSEPKYLQVTGISAADIVELCNMNCTVVLDLCEPDRQVQFGLSVALPDANISFDSCAPGDTRNANQLRDRIDAGATPKAALQALIKSEKALAVQSAQTAPAVSEEQDVAEAAAEAAADPADEPKEDQR